MRHHATLLQHREQSACSVEGFLQDDRPQHFQTRTTVLIEGWGFYAFRMSLVFWWPSLQQCWYITTTVKHAPLALLWIIPTRLVQWRFNVSWVQPPSPPVKVKKRWVGKTDCSWSCRSHQCCFRHRCSDSFSSYDVSGCTFTHSSLFMARWVSVLYSDVRPVHVICTVIEIKSPFCSWPLYKKK